MVDDTSFDDINADVFHTSFDLLPYKFTGDLVYGPDALCVLGSQGRLCGHRIAAMSGNDLLIGLESAVVVSISLVRIESSILSYAPPELSVPATTNMRFMVSLLTLSSEYERNLGNQYL